MDRKIENDVWYKTEVINRRTEDIFLRTFMRCVKFSYFYKKTKKYVTYEK